MKIMFFFFFEKKKNKKHCSIGKSSAFHISKKSKILLFPVYNRGQL